MNDLLDEIGNEVDLDSKLPDPATEIAARLARLKGEDKVKNNEQPGTLIVSVDHQEKYFFYYSDLSLNTRAGCFGFK